MNIFKILINSFLTVECLFFWFCFFFKNVHTSFEHHNSTGLGDTLHLVPVHVSGFCVTLVLGMSCFVCIGLCENVCQFNSLMIKLLIK